MGGFGELLGWKSSTRSGNTGRRGSYKGHRLERLLYFALVTLNSEHNVCQLYCVCFSVHIRICSQNEFFVSNVHKKPRKKVSPPFHYRATVSEHDTPTAQGYRNDFERSAAEFTNTLLLIQNYEKGCRKTSFILLHNSSFAESDGLQT